MEEMKHINRGQICCLRAVTSIDFLISYFALHKVGGVAVPLEKSLPDETYKIISEKMCSYKVPEGSADILYTTGTTGKSKGVIISHRTILADAENLIDGQGFSRDLAFVINGPLNHIGSLSKIYPVIMLGGTVILVDGLKDINKFFEAFNYPAAKMATFLVPASIRMLIQFSSEKIKALAEKMEFIETGAAAISQSDMLELCRLLPHTRLYNTYASTETGIICTYNYNDGKCVSGCLGKPMKHSSITISDKGKIICYGDTLMSGYVDDPEMTASILRDGAIFTSDVGKIDENGMLHLIGREGDVINVGGFKVAPTEVEDAALAFPDVEDCVCVPVDHIITGKALKLLVVMKCEKNLDGRELALFLKSRLETYKVPLLYSQIEHVERTFNGKINRKYYIDV
jgi:acyl-CoA synthetase (AMP-forming)/AMP-acid ligase II